MPDAHQTTSSGPLLKEGETGADVRVVRPTTRGMTMRARAMALAALAAVALAAGCGGGGDGGEGGDRLTTEEFLQQADAICAEANQQLDALGEPQSVEELATMAPQALSISEQTLDSLRELSPPEELEAQFDRALELLGQQNALAQELVTAAEAGDQAQLESIVAQAEPLDTEADAIADELGLEECGDS
jgi:hypothetical protein